MSILVVSSSHRTTGVDELARAGLDAAAADKLVQVLTRSDCVDEALVLSTCNRVEVYAAVTRFHGGLEEVVEGWSALSGMSVEQLQAGCAVFYDEAAVQHCFGVASGLESMVAGEQQILGQVRSALAAGQASGTVGTVLNSLFQQALRVGKRVHTETAAGAAGRSLVTAALDQLAGSEDGSAVVDLAGTRVLVIGAGTMASLAARTAYARGAVLHLANRTRERADRLAATVEGTVHDWSAVTGALAGADVVVSCTGARGFTLTAGQLAGTGVRAVVDLGLPADVDPQVAGLPGVRLVNLASLSRGGFASASESELEVARELVRGEVTDFLGSRRAAQVTPTVVALRSMASEVTAAELARLELRAPDLTEGQRREIASTVRRVAEKLLHQPTVRVKQLSADPDSPDYARALRELFALNTEAVRAVSVAEPGEPS